MDKSVALGVTKFILSDLTAEDVSERSKCVVQSFVVNSSIQILNEDIALTGLAQSRVPLRPHDTAGTAFDDCVVQLFHSSLSICGVVVVDVGISKRATSDCVTADTN